MNDVAPVKADGSVLQSTAAAPNSLLAVIARAASDPRVDVAKMQALLDMQRQLQADEARAEFNAAFARLAPRLPRVKKSGEVTYPEDKSKPTGRQKKAFNYARWEDIDAAIRPLLLEEGFALSYDTQVLPDGKIAVVGILAHVGGHERRTVTAPLPFDTSGGKNNVQAAGSTMSYGKRYAATALLNLVFEGEDDDGQAGGAEYLSAEGVGQLDRLLRAGRVDLGQFCAGLGVNGLPDIKAADFEKAISLINALRAKAQAERGAKG